MCAWDNMPTDMYTVIQYAYRYVYSYTICLQICVQLYNMPTDMCTVIQYAYRYLWSDVVCLQLCLQHVNSICFVFYHRLDSYIESGGLYNLQQNKSPGNRAFLTCRWTLALSSSSSSESTSVRMSNLCSNAHVTWNATLQVFT